MDTTDQPSSICHIQPIQMYTLRPPSPNKSPPFNLSAGEMEIHSGTSVDGVIVVTNYRLYLQIGSNQHHIPLGLIESAEHKDLSYLQIGCKDARTYRCTFENNESCMEWYDRIQKAAETPKQIEQLFAFYHYVWTKEKDGFGIARYNDRYDTFDKRMFENEMTRLQFEGHSWRISKVNENYKLCPSYPPYLLVPSCINDEMLESVAKFRSSRRIPAAVWRHTKNGAVIARCSQPEVGWLGWRSSEDEDLIKAISEACNFDRNFSKTNDKESNLSHSPGSLNSDESLHHISSPSQPQQEKKVLIMDARSYTTAVANRARGGGCECPEYYPNCEIEFMNLANIHSIRKSFHALRNLCMTSDQPNWFSQLEGTRWLLHMSGLMKAALTLVTAVERDARPVLVHCSDGWDRTPQIVALAELMLDPYFRTFDGFRILIEREWLAFGHKFADRCGHSSGSDDQNERCPVFLQWLDCVHQLLIQYPCAFEFTQLYLVKLAQHTYSNFFGTFLCNTQQERSKLIYGKTFSVWEFLNTPSFRNHLYCSIRNKCGRKVLWPQCNVRNLYLWAEIYLGSMEANFSAEGGSGSCPGPPETSPHHNSMTKTRSFGDLNNAGEVSASMFRRSSDPNINNNSDKKLNDLASSDDLPQEVMTNGRNHSLDQELDEVECNNDCIFKNSSQTLTDDQIDGLDLADFKSIETTSTKTDDEQSMFSELVINGGDTKTDLRNDDCELVDVRKKSICLISDDALKKAGDINSNCNNSVFGGSNGAICDSNCGDRFEKSVETSTETLVSENNFIISTPKEIVNGLENAADECDSINGSNNDISCKACGSKSVQTNYSQKSSGQTSRNSTPPLQSRTSSNNDWDNAVPSGRKFLYNSYQYALGDDGLVPLRSDVQDRLNQIIEEHKKKEDFLNTRLQILIKQVCHKCSHENDRQDDNSESEYEESPNENLRQSFSSSSPVRFTPPLSSVVESVCSVGEGQASAVESSCSDMSWEALENTESPSARWVPDHAVSHCNRCNKAFWFAKRKHHCRKCGNIFCADCSKNSTPLPSEQLFQPVRVCCWCYSELRRDDIPDQCKQDNSQPTNNNPQITASSN